MEIKPAITKLFEIFQQIDSAQPVKPGFAIKFDRYKTHSGKIALFICIISPPTSRLKGKEKNYEKIFKKSEESDKLIDENAYPAILSFVNSIFHSIIKPRNEILEQILGILAGLRLGFVPMHNIKYSFIDPNNPRINVVSTVRNAQFSCYINIMGLKEDGLYLAYEKQIRYIKNEAKKGINPNFAQNLPALRTGDTQFEYNRTDQKPKEEESNSLQSFRKKIFQKKVESQIDEELAFETVIDFQRNNGESKPEPKKEQAVRYSPFGTPIFHKNDETANEEDKSVKDSREKKNSKESRSEFDNFTPKPKNLPKPPPMPIVTINEIQSEITSENLANSVNSIDRDHTEKIVNNIATDGKQTPSISLSEAQTKINDLEEQNSNLQDQLQRITDSLTNQLAAKDAEIKRLKEEPIQKRKESNNSKEDVLENKKISELEQKLESYDRIIKNLEKERSNFKKKISELNAKIPKSPKSSNEVEIQLFSLQKENQLLTNALKKSDQKFQALLKENTELTSKNESILSEKLNLEIVLTDLQNEIQEIRNQIKK